MYCHRCHFYGPFTLRSPATGLLDLVLFETEEFLLYFSSLSSLPHLQVVVPICDLAAKVFSPSFTTDVLPSYNTAHHLIRDVNSSKESFSHRYFLFQGKEYICLLEDSEQAMCLFKMSAVRFKVGSFKTVYPSSKLFLKIIWRAK